FFTFVILLQGPCSCTNIRKVAFSTAEEPFRPFYLCFRYTYTNNSTVLLPTQICL
ncbi:hypothetical protein L9F63_026285, partial [Diploptera punctata]